MRQRMMVLLTALSMAALVAGGCASNEVVKTEEPGAATVKPETAKPLQQPYDKKEEPAVPAQKRLLVHPWISSLPTHNRLKP